jgi:deazaflavin-dependent oxidoreductase (nitroreductase family)
MAAVASERDFSFEGGDDRGAEAGGAGLRAPGVAEGAWSERLSLWFVSWSMRHPRTLLRVSLISFRLGLGRFAADMVVTTTGRTSGLPRRAVLGAIVIDGHLYAMNPGFGQPRPGDLDHPFGERAHWYKNLLADPIVTVQRGGRTWTARTSGVTDRDEAVTLYEGLSGATRTALRSLLHAQGIADTSEAFAENIERLCFVRLDEIDQPGPSPMTPDLVWVWPVAAALGLLSWLVRRRLGVSIATALLAVPALVSAALRRRRA